MPAELILEGFKSVLKRIENDDKQVRFAGSKALNIVSRRSVDSQKRDMRLVFDRPTRFIVNSLRVSKFATRDKPESRVGFKDVFQSIRFDPVADTLLPHIDGGARRPKRSELRLRRFGVLKQNEYLVPSRTAPLDRFGNIRRGVMQRILSDLGSFSDRGFDGNRKGNAKRQYVFGKVGSTKGIFRVRGGAMRAATNQWSLIFLIVSSTPRYRKRFNFFDNAEKFIEKNIVGEFERQYADARRTAR